MHIADSNHPPTAKRLVLSLLSAPTAGEVSIGLLVKWGELFDIDPATVRVTVGRLTRQGLLASPQRGSYCIGPQGKVIAEKAGNWLHREARIAPWDGQWILVHTGHLGRTNRAALRGRERAFRLNGFAELVSGLWLRPANLVGSLAAVRTELESLGLEPEALVSLATELQGVDEQALLALWPRDTMESAYDNHCRIMQESTARLGSLSLAEAARETIEVGEAVIRQINADPMLPEPMVNAKSRRSMTEQMKRYDALGRDVWQRYTAELEAALAT